MSDAFTPYETGLARFQEHLEQDHPRYAEALTLEAQLRENVGQARLDGDTEIRRADRARILRELNRLALETVRVSFNRLCGLPGVETGGASLPPRAVQSVNPEQERQLKVLLCHACGDKPAVRDLYHRLRAAGFDPWLDEENLLPGQDWQLEITKAVRSSDVVIVCLSSRAITQAGHVQEETKHALDVADEQPEGAIFLITVRLEECEVPERVWRWQRFDLFRETGYERLLRALRARAESLGLFRPAWEPEMILIPAGEFLMGSDPNRDKHARHEEQPQHTLYLPDYYIAKSPVTKAQYAAFVQAAGYNLPVPDALFPVLLQAIDHVLAEDWRDGKPPRGQEDHPVVYVSLQDAVAYCKWLSQVTDKPYRLPSEAEWEKAARGTDGRIYPWGDEPPDEGQCNFGMNVGSTTPVGRYSPQGNSPYGCADMAGNVWEWTRSPWGENWEKPDFGYPYDPRDGRENPESGQESYRVLRGGAFNYEVGGVRCAARGRFAPSVRDKDIGFRVVATRAPG